MNDLYGVQEFFVNEMEYEAELRRRARKGDQLVIELQQRGPLFDYAIERQGEAIEALRDLVKIDPNDAANIAKLQARIEAFIDVRSWIDATADAGDAADRALTGDDRGDPNGHAYVD